MKYNIKLKFAYNNIILKIDPIILRINPIDSMKKETEINIIFCKWDNKYISYHQFYKNEIAQFLINNNFVTLIKQDTSNLYYSKYTFQLTPKSLLELL